MMPFSIVRGDITKIRADAIVDPTDESFSGGGGADRAIHEAARPGLRDECARLAPLAVGAAVATGGHRLPCRYVIHTVGPRWGGGEGDESALASCYRSSLELARRLGCESAAIPLIASGKMGFPKATALKIATEEIRSALAIRDMDITLVVFDHASFEISSRLFDDIAQYIDDEYADLHGARAQRSMPPAPSAPLARTSRSMSDEIELCVECDAASMPDALEICEDIKELASAPAFLKASGLSDELLDIDETFSEMLMRKIGEKGIKHADCYKRANIDKKLFSKIKNDRFHKPKKKTAIAFAISLALTREETDELLGKAGYALTRSSRADIIVSYFIRSGIYDIFEINEALFAFGEDLLGY